MAHKARDIFASQKLLIGFLGSATSFFLGGTKKGGWEMVVGSKMGTVGNPFFCRVNKRAVFFFFRKDFSEVCEEQTTI